MIGLGCVRPGLAGFSSVPFEPDFTRTKMDIVGLGSNNLAWLGCTSVGLLGLSSAGLGLARLGSAWLGKAPLGFAKLGSAGMH